MQQTYITKGFLSHAASELMKEVHSVKAVYLKKKRHIKNIKLFLDINGSIIPQS